MACRQRGTAALLMKVVDVSCVVSSQTLQHFTQASLSSLWELWLNNSNQSTLSICDLQNTAFSLLWPPKLLDCRTVRHGEVESSDGGLAHNGMQISGVQVTQWMPHVLLAVGR